MKFVLMFQLKKCYAPKVNQKGLVCLYNLNHSLMIKYLNLGAMLESHTFFTKMVDELVEFSQYDPELADGIKWLDSQAQKKGISFYDMVFEVLYKHDIDSKAKKWLNSRN